MNSQKRVMIVDDSPVLHNILIRALMETDESLKILHAYNCKEAIQLFSSAGPSTVIQDINLPDGSGIDLLRKFKEEDPRARVIIFTGYPTDEFRKVCMDLGASNFIDKSNICSLIAEFK